MAQSIAFARTPAALAIAVAMAGTTGSALAGETYELGEVVVTAARTAQTVDETLAPVTVITRKDIERSQASSVSDLLRKTPGLQVTDSGGQGAATSIFLRGTNSNHALVLIDGVRINSATGGQPAIPYLDTNQIERIEIVRGPKSSLYGADAIGGVIQIFTRKGKGKPQLTVKVGAGSRDSSNADLNFGGQVDNTRFNINTNFQETQGFDRTVSTSDNDDEDAYRNKSFSANISHDFSNDAQLGFSVSHNQGKSEYDGGDPSELFTEFKSTVYHASYNLPVTDNWETRLEIGFSEDDKKEKKKSVQTGDISDNGYFKTDRKTFSWLNDLAWSDNHLLTAGFDYYKDNVDDGKGYINPKTNQKVDSRDNNAIFVQNLSEFGWSDLSVGLRSDDNEAYGNHTTGNVAWGISLPRETKLIASYGTAYRAPTMYELYAPTSSWNGVIYKSNANLKPEKSESYEVELKGQLSQASWAVSIFENNIDDMISYQTVNSVSMPVNVSRARIRGVELSLSTRAFEWDLRSNLTFLDTENLSTGEQLLKRAKQELNISLDRQFGRVEFGGDFRAKSKTMHYGGVEIAGYGVLDLRAAMLIVPELKAEVKLVNALDKNYQTTAGYNPEPRGGFVTLIWTPKIQ